jgi:predicted TIM-barrel fold metal-dependent hydrolase
MLVHPPKLGEFLEVVRTHLRINFFIAHLGSFASRDWRDHLAAIEAARNLPNLYLDTSGVIFHYL